MILSKRTHCSHPHRYRTTDLTVYCEHDLQGGGWTIFARVMDTNTDSAPYSTSSTLLFSKMIYLICHTMCKQHLMNQAYNPLII